MSKATAGEGTGHPAGVNSGYPTPCSQSEHLSQSTRQRAANCHLWASSVGSSPSPNAALEALRGAAPEALRGLSPARLPTDHKDHDDALPTSFPSPEHKLLEAKGSSLPPPEPVRHENFDCMLNREWVLNNAAFPSGSMVKNRLPMEETKEMQVGSLGLEDPLEEEMATHSSILA